MRKSATDRVWPGGAISRPQRAVADPGAGKAVAGCLPIGASQRTGSPIGGARLKRGLDVLLAAILLLPAAPVLLLAALAVRLETPGPALFQQTRVGRYGRRFRILKLRTLHTGAGSGQVLPRDPRITRVGYWLRRTSLDELPQLVNVLRGEMSLVGPRPHALPDDLRFARLHPGYVQRRQVRPGMTGWAQVQGCRGAIRRPAELDRRTRHDLAYVTGRSLAVDLLILLRTVRAVSAGAAGMPPRD